MTLRVHSAHFQVGKFATSCRFLGGWEIKCMWQNFTCIRCPFGTYFWNLFHLFLTVTIYDKVLQHVSSVTQMCDLHPRSAIWLDYQHNLRLHPPLQFPRTLMSQLLLCSCSSALLAFPALSRAPAPPVPTIPVLADRVIWPCSVIILQCLSTSFPLTTVPWSITLVYRPFPYIAEQQRSFSPFLPHSLTAQSSV